MSDFQAIIEVMSVVVCNCKAMYPSVAMYRVDHIIGIIVV